MALVLVFKFERTDKPYNRRAFRFFGYEVHLRCQILHHRSLSIRLSFFLVEKSLHRSSLILAWQPSVVSIMIAVYHSFVFCAFAAMTFKIKQPSSVGAKTADTPRLSGCVFN